MIGPTRRAAVQAPPERRTPVERTTLVLDPVRATGTDARARAPRARRREGTSARAGLILGGCAIALVLGMLADLALVRGGPSWTHLVPLALAAIGCVAGVVADGAAGRAALARVAREAEALVEELHEKTEYARATGELSRLAQSDRAALEVAGSAATILGVVVDADWIGLALTRPERVSFRGVSRTGAPPAFEQLGLDGAPARALNALVERGEPAYEDALGAATPGLGALVDAGARAAALTPLPAASEGGRAALLAVRSRERRPWTEPQRELFEMAARAVAIAVERRARFTRLQDAASRDALTGLGNRRAFDADLAAELERSARSGAHVSVLSMDLDGLKLINDTEGHERGDALLRRFAECLRAHFRADDRLYRLGGDEYVAILPGVQSEGAPIVLGRVRGAIDDVRASGFTAADVSAGLAAFPADARAADALVRLSDERMYEQKQARKLERRAAGLPTGRDDRIEALPDPALAMALEEEDVRLEV